MAEAQPVAWTWGVMSHNRDNITSDRAHAVLCENQKCLKQQSFDLTDGRLLDWWGYLTGHPRSRDIVGNYSDSYEGPCRWPLAFRIRGGLVPSLVPSSPSLVLVLLV